jgi:ribonuclease BN (tRNA processing enzyme)
METLTVCASVNDAKTTKYLWSIWNQHPSVALSGVNNLLVGYSWAALRTNFVCNRLVFDAGLSYPGGSDYIFLTHGHSDHSASIYFHTLAPMPPGEKRLIYVPTEIKDEIDQLLQLTYRISNPIIPFDQDLAGMS